MATRAEQLQYWKERWRQISLGTTRLDEDWITVNGTHIPLDESGNAMGGGKLKGKNFSRAKSQKRTQKSGAKGSSSKLSSFRSGTVEDKISTLKSVDKVKMPQHLNQRSYAQKVAYSLDVNGKPEVLSHEEFDKKVAEEGRKVIHRGVRNTPTMTADEINDMTIHGEETYYGNGQNGDGIYFSTKEHDADVYAGISGRNKQENPGSKMQAYLNDNAKVINLNDLEDKMYDWSPNSVASQLRDAGVLRDDESVFALAMGYNVIEKRANDGTSFYCVLDRTALTCRDNGRTDAETGKITVDNSLAYTFNGFASRVTA